MLHFVNILNSFFYFFNKIFKNIKEKHMARKIIDLSLTVEDNMPAHKLFQSPIIYQR